MIRTIATAVTRESKSRLGQVHTLSGWVLIIISNAIQTHKINQIASLASLSLQDTREKVEQIQKEYDWSLALL